MIKPLIKEEKSRRGNIMELQVCALISEYCMYCTSLDSFKHNMELAMQRLPRTSTAVAHVQYQIKLIDDRAEVWHDVKKPRLIAVVRVNKEYKDN